VNTRGGITAEYVAVLVLVSFGLAVAAYNLGPQLVKLYELQRAVVSVPML